MAIEDMAIMRALPNMAVTAVADAEEMKRFMRATLDHPSPIYIRLGKGGDKVVTPADQEFVLGKAVELKPARDVAFLTTGVMASRALGAAEILAQRGIEAGVLHLPTLKPLDEDAVLALAKRVPRLVTVEEHTLVGGLGSAVAELILDKGLRPSLLRLALPDRFPDDYGSQEHLLGVAGLDPKGIAGAVLRQ
jgi:transketolase